MANQALDYVHRIDTSTCTGGLAVAPGTYRYEKFCAYAYKKDGDVHAHDISIQYDYHINTTEWWYGPQTKDFSNVSIVNDRVFYRQTQTADFKHMTNLLQHKHKLKTGTHRYEKFCAYAYKKDGDVHAHDISMQFDYHIDTTEYQQTNKPRTSLTSRSSTTGFSRVESFQRTSNVLIVKDGVLYRWKTGTQRYEKFCAYAYKKDGEVHAHDISIQYDYHINTTEWWYGPQTKDISNVSIVNDRIFYRRGNKSLPVVSEKLPLADRSSGYWTKPYYDCGGGNVWMVTYLAPLLGLNPERDEAFFQGISAVDVELTNIDINQCDPDENSPGAMDVFRGTHHCLPSTKCIPIQGQGFQRGAYKCVCEKGFYFPSSDSLETFYRGYEIEDVHGADKAKYGVSFLCLPCEPGCSTCVDNSPCLYEHNMVYRTIVLLTTSVAVVGIVLVSLTTFLYRRKMIFVAFPEPNNFTCALHVWLLHLGFVLLYGVLVMRTWRICLIFRVESRRKKQLPDRALLQRLFPFICVATGYMAAWTGAAAPEVITTRTASDLKYPVCSEGLWSYAAQGGEVLVLLFGCYMCFTVRKVSPHSNESRKIAWSLYNAIIFGCFILVIKISIGSSSGPDVLYGLAFLRVQAYVTVTLMFTFAPKFWAIYKNIDTHQEETDTTRQNTLKTSATGRVRKTPVSTKVSRWSKKRTDTRCSQTDIAGIAGTVYAVCK
ncbi:hypothetical protein ScPMuIL_014288 [Solemya velum]